MTSPVRRVEDPSSRRDRPSLLRLLVIRAILVGLAGTAFGIWYFYLRTPPAAVSLDTTRGAAVAASATASASAAGSTTTGATASVATRSPAVSSATAPSGSADASGGPAAVTAEIEGTWTVDESVGSFSDFTSSFVGYRVNETLGTIGATTAVGRTPDVSGSLTVDGTTISAAEMSADLTTLRSDDGRRDGQLRRQAIETDTFPTATFVLTEPIELTGPPAEGEEVSVTATGQFTLHGVTRTVQIPLQARLSSGVVTVVGSLEVLFADYGIEKPRAQIVVDVEDHGVMEFQLHFTRG